MPLAGLSSRHYTQFKPRGRSSRPALGLSSRYYTQFITHNNGILFIAPAVIPWTGQPLAVNARVRIDIAPADLAWVGQSLTVNARRRLDIGLMALPWTGQELTITTFAPPPVLRPRWRIRVDWPA